MRFRDNNTRGSTEISWSELAQEGLPLDPPDYWEVEADRRKRLARLEELDLDDI